MPNSNRQVKTDGSLKESGAGNASLELEFKRIVKFIDVTVDKLTFAMTIPKLLDNDYDLIKVHLTEGELETLNQAFRKYIPKESLWLGKNANIYSKLTSMQSIKRIQEYFNTYSVRTENVPQQDEYKFSNALQLLYDKEEIKLIAKENKLSISEAGFNFIQDMKLFFYSLIDQMKLPPQQAEAREMFLRKLCVHHRELTDEAHILEEEAKEQVKSTEETLKQKLYDLKEIKDKINNLMNECRDFVQKSGDNANKLMIFNWKSSEYRQETLEAKVQRQMVDLEMLRKKYVMEEKELRTKRYKTEQHLISFLEQYDKDMQNKQNEIDVQDEIVSQEKEQYDQLNEQFQDQEVTYDLIMKEKEEYETRLFEAKLYELKCSLSARKIQRFYKNFKKLVRIAGKKDLLRKRKSRKTMSIKVE